MINETNYDTIFGRIAVEQGLCTIDELQHSLEELKSRRNVSPTTLAELMVELGYVTAPQTERLKKTIKESKAAAHQIAGYRILGKLGAGAMAIVYKAQQLSLNRTVAIKILPKRFSENPEYVERFYDSSRIREVRESYPDHCLIFGTHMGPFTAGYMAMGFERFFFRFFDDPAFVHRLLEVRTEWCIAVYQKALDLGAEVLVLGDDAASSRGPMISNPMWREFVLPYHQRIVESLGAPMIWHSDGNIVPLLPMAIEAGFVGVHGLEPAAGIDLAQVKRDFGGNLALIGNVTCASCALLTWKQSAAMSGVALSRARRAEATCWPPATASLMA